MENTEFEERILTCESRLYRIARSMLACDQDCADALQEGVLRAWQRLYSLRDEKRFDAWLTRIVINECRNIQRGNKRRPVSLETMPENGELPPDPGLQSALEGLDEKYRLPLVLHYGEGFSVKEISGMIRLPQSTIKWRLHEGRRLLHAALQEEGN